MSLLCRNKKVERAFDRKLVVAASSSLLLVGATAEAAQYYFQPSAELSAEANTNLTMEPGVNELDEGYGFGALAGATFGIVTPVSETTVQPELRVPYYLDQDDVNNLSGGIDFASLYRSTRSRLNVLGRFEQHDELDAQLPDAQFDSLTANSQNQDLLTTPEIGSVRVGATRTQYLFNPNYSYDLTQRVSLDAAAFYQKTDYSPDGASDRFADYEYYKAQLGLTRHLTQRLDLSVAAYGAMFEALDTSAQTEVVGGSVGTQYQWSQTSFAGINVFVEQDKFDELSVSAGNDDKATAYGADFNLGYQWQISSILLNVGRTVTPSGAGGLYYSDQFQVQYNRDLSQRLKFLVAARFLRDESVEEASSGSERKYVQTDFALTWEISTTLFVRGAYEYVWQESSGTSDDAQNNKLILSFGYRGLGPRR